MLIKYRTVYDAAGANARHGWKIESCDSLCTPFKIINGNLTHNMKADCHFLSSLIMPQGRHGRH